MIDPPSPCNQVCRMDAASGTCAGCQRSMAEIVGWPQFSAVRKRQVLDAIEQRRRQGAAGP